MSVPVIIFLSIFFVLLVIILIILFVLNIEIDLFYKYDKDIHKLKFLLRISKLVIKQHKVDFNKPGAPKKKEKRSKLAFRYIGRALEIDNVSSELNIKVVEGTDDAAETAILYGLLYFAAEMIKVAFAANTDLVKDNIEIICDFNKKVFSVDISCIFKLKLVNAIPVGLKLYKLNKNNDKVGDINV